VSKLGISTLGRAQANGVPSYGTNTCSELHSLRPRYSGMRRRAADADSNGSQRVVRPASFRTPNGFEKRYQLGLATTLEAFRHNPADVASYQSPVGLVLSQWSVPVVPLVLHRNSVKIATISTHQ